MFASCFGSDCASVDLELGEAAMTVRKMATPALYGRAGLN